MKKISLIILCIPLLLLTSCGKTKFENLPEDKQKEIGEKIKTEVLAPYFKDVLGIGFDFSKTQSEKEKLANEKLDEFKKELVSYTDKNYPDIEFNYDNLMKVDNSTVDKTSKPIEKIYKSVRYKDFYSMSGSENEDSKINIGIDSITWKGQKISDGYLEYTAKNEFLSIRLKSENIGKKPNFFPIRDGVLITSDGTEYKSTQTMQINSQGKEYGGCIECSSNPGDKNLEDLLFDIKEINLAGAKIRFEDYGVDFEL